jgi:hypothetical protein
MHDTIITRSVNKVLTYGRLMCCSVYFLSWYGKSCGHYCYQLFLGFFNLSVLLTSSKISKYGNTFQMYDNLLFITIWFIIFIVFILQTFQLLFVPSVYPAQVWSGPIQLIVLSISIVVKLVSGQERFYESVHIRCYLIPPVILVKTTHQLHVDLERNIQHHVSIIILSWNVFLASHTNIKSSDTFHF